jgi:histone acetyltransferase MYST1
MQTRPLFPPAVLWLTHPTALYHQPPQHPPPPTHNPQKKNYNKKQHKKPSKEKNCQSADPATNYNLACILTLPAYQRKGYGRFLIALAYQLSRLEGRPGTAERPLSDLGAVSFRSYWQRAVLDVLKEARGGDVSVSEISEKTAMTPGDVTDTLRRLGLLNYWKGSHYISASARVVEEYCRQVAGQRVLEVDARFLHWQPLSAPVGGGGKK